MIYLQWYSNIKKTKQNHQLWISWFQISLRKQTTFGAATPPQVSPEMTSEKRAQKFHTDDASQNKQTNKNKEENRRQQRY